MEWYYANHGKQVGPVGLADLQAKLRSGEVLPTDLVWREGMAAWTAAGDVTELTALQSPQPGMPMMVVAPASGYAIASMVCGILGIVLCSVSAIAAIPAVICGHVALKQIRNSMVPTAGRGMAMAGLVMGYIGLLFQVVFIIYIVMNTMGAY